MQLSDFKQVFTNMMEDTQTWAVNLDQIQNFAQNMKQWSNKLCSGVCDFFRILIDTSKSKVDEKKEDITQYCSQYLSSITIPNVTAYYPGTDELFDLYDKYVVKFNTNDLVTAFTSDYDNDTIISGQALWCQDNMDDSVVMPSTQVDCKIGDILDVYSNILEDKLSFDAICDGISISEDVSQIKQNVYAALQNGAETTNMAVDSVNSFVNSITSADTFDTIKARLIYWFTNTNNLNANVESSSDSAIILSAIRSDTGYTTNTIWGFATDFTIGAFKNFADAVLKVAYAAIKFIGKGVRTFVQKMGLAIASWVDSLFQDDCYVYDTTRPNYNELYESSAVYSFPLVYIRDLSVNIFDGCFEDTASFAIAARFQGVNSLSRRYDYTRYFEAVSNKPLEPWYLLNFGVSKKYMEGIGYRYVSDVGDFRKNFVRFLQYFSNIRKFSTIGMNYYVFIEWKKYEGSLTVGDTTEALNNIDQVPYLCFICRPKALMSNHPYITNYKDIDVNDMIQKHLNTTVLSKDYCYGASNSKSQHKLIKYGYDTITRNYVPTMQLNNGNEWNKFQLAGSVVSHLDPTVEYTDDIYSEIYDNILNINSNHVLDTRNATQWSSIPVIIDAFGIANGTLAYDSLRNSNKFTGRGLLSTLYPQELEQDYETVQQLDDGSLMHEGIPDRLLSHIMNFNQEYETVDGVRTYKVKVVDTNQEERVFIFGKFSDKVVKHINEYLFSDLINLHTNLSKAYCFILSSFMYILDTASSPYYYFQQAEISAIPKARFHFISTDDVTNQGKSLVYKAGIAIGAIIIAGLYFRLRRTIRTNYYIADQQVKQASAAYLSGTGSIKDVQKGISKMNTSKLIGKYAGVKLNTFTLDNIELSRNGNDLQISDIVALIRPGK